MSHILAIFLFAFSSLSYAKVQCLTQRDIIQDHCKEVENSKVTCPEGFQAYNCSNIAQSCPGYQLENKAYGFNSFQPSKQIINSVSFPRNDRYIYRGIPQSVTQITLEKFIPAIFGDDIQNIGTVYQWRASQYLKGEISKSDVVRKQLVKGVKETKISKMIKNMKIGDDIEKLKDCSSSFTDRDAQRYASDLMSKSFKEIQKENLTQKYFLKFDYDNNSDYRKFGNWGEYLIFGSVYSNVASWLSGKMIMYNNSNARAMDLNYYNHMIGEKWTYADADNGEVVAPGVITPDELEGLIYSSSGPRETDRLDPSRIDIAYLRYKDAGSDYILIVNGDYNTCLTKDSHGVPYFCNQEFVNYDIAVDNPWDKSNKLIFGPPKLTHEASIIGIIEKKNPQNEISHASDLFKRFKISTRRLSAGLIDRIESIRFFNGDTVMATKLTFPNEKIEIKKPKPTKVAVKKTVIKEVLEEKKVHIISAHFGRGHRKFSENNLHSYVSNYCNEKLSCDYAIKPGVYFPKRIVRKSKSAKLEVIYKCFESDDAELLNVTANAGDILTISCE